MTFGIAGRVGRLTLSIVHKLAEFLRNIARITYLIYSTIMRLPLFVKNVPLAIEQMYAIGIGSLPLVSIIAVFLGAETVLQAEYQFRNIIPLKYLGTAVCKSITNELGPVVTSLVVSGRVATAIAAEIGSMKTTEQLDAMNILNLDPIRYLIVPKTIACVIMIPALVIWSELLAVLGSIVTVALSLDVTMYTYATGLKLFFTSGDLFMGIAKSMVFGGIIAVTGCYFGYEAKGGAKGVGNATTRAVMTSAVLILIFDFLIAALFW
ncbi:MAG: ABC transporter permease [Chitinivibrionales bacterium]|nr:ABC transporter permease [Chitinivibrionales bacterium]